MEIRTAQKQDLEKLAKLYKDTFKVHNIFQKPVKDIIQYLENAEGELIIALENNEVIGGILVKIGNSTEGHKRSRLKHIAIKKEFQNKGAGSALLKTAENMIVTGKVEIHVAELEKDAVEFYKKNGYNVEKELESHYRTGETCYILGKVLG